MTIEPGLVLSHYRLDEKLGEGGMGLVYRAWDQRLERSVAIKLISERLLADANARGRLLREARTASALSHPNICVIHEVNVTDSRAYIVMELVEGKLLSALIPQDGLPVETVLRYAIQVADALAHAHERSIVHRDLKSPNVFITPEGRVKVLDFGLAKRLSRGDPEAEMTRSVAPLTGAGTIVGTLHYIPPEVLRGAVGDTRGDLWALGVMLFEMAAGRLPFPGRTPFEISSAILTQPPAPFPAGVPAGLRGVIQRCLVKEPEQRYQRAGELRAALEALQSAASAPPAEPRPASRRRRTKAAGPIRALAVLPLDNLSGDPAQEYFADGMTEALIAGLARIGTLRVISRTSVMLCKGARRPLPQIARELKVDAVVEGSVLRSGDQVRITAQLIRAASDELLWSETYDRGLRDVLALQSEVARAIAQEIQVKLTPREEASLAHARAVDPAAYEAYLRGRYSWNKRTESGLREGIDYFEQAIEKDPTYALAYTGLADCYNVSGHLGALSPKDSFLRAKAAATKALEIEKDLGEAHCSLAYALQHYDWDWAAVERQYLTALELNPGYPTGHYWYALYLLSQGRAEGAVAEMVKAGELDPLSQIIMLALGWVYYMTRQYDRAIAQFRKTLKDHPRFWLTRGDLGMAYVRKEMYQEAITECAQAVEMSGSLPLMVATLAHARALSGDREEALKAVEELREVSKQRYVMPYAIALIYTGL
ncbi:MAG TPA: protein kinase, partial [Candidatus Polarisedimenticolia bacterium]|nr:protein kinase [Candidatus Polarisedimenticolia bacterium]